MLSYSLIELENHFEVWKIYNEYHQFYGCYSSYIEAVFDISQDKDFVYFI